MLEIMLIWDAADYGIKVFKLSGDEAELALRCAGQYINDSDLPEDAPIYELSTLIDGKPDDYSINSPIPITDQEHIVICGFIP